MLFEYVRNMTHIKWVRFRICAVRWTDYPCTALNSVSRCAPARILWKRSTFLPNFEYLWHNSDVIRGMIQFTNDKAEEGCCGLGTTFNWTPYTYRFDWSRLEGNRTYSKFVFERTEEGYKDETWKLLRYLWCNASQIQIANLERQAGEGTKSFALDHCVERPCYHNSELR